MTKPFPIRQIAAERGLRLFKEECYDSAPRVERDWFLEMRGTGGTLYGNSEHTFWVDTTSGRASRYEHIGPIQAVVSPDGREARFLFAMPDLDAVLTVLEPRKKRVLSDEHRKRLAEASAASRFRGSGSA